jgi:hypothetical protein
MKTLISVLVTSVLLLGSPTAVAKCKYMGATVNTSTGEEILWTRWEGIETGGWNRAPTFSAAAVAEGDNRYLAISLKVQDTSPQRPTKSDLENRVDIAADQMLLVRLADDNVLQLLVAKAAVSDTDFKLANAVHDTESMRDYSRNYYMTSFTTIKYVLDADAIAKLASSKAVDFRVQTSRGDIDFNFKRGTNDVQKLMECFP